MNRRNAIHLVWAFVILGEEPAIAASAEVDAFYAAYVAEIRDKLPFSFDPTSTITDVRYIPAFGRVTASLQYDVIKHDLHRGRFDEDEYISDFTEKLRHEYCTNDFYFLARRDDVSLYYFFHYADGEFFEIPKLPAAHPADC